jgi:hypothetical protein
MATNIPYKYKENNLASLAAKCQEEQLDSTNVTYINPKNTKYTNFTPGDTAIKYRFIPYNPGKITDASGNNIWAGTKAAFSPHYQSTTISGFDKLDNVAAWGSAPIPLRLGLGNQMSGQYTDSVNITTIPSTLTLTWNSSTGITRSDTNAVLTKASCIIVDVCAGGGNGGSGYYASSTYGKHSGGGGGGAGAAASLCIDMSKASKITFTNSSSTVYVKNSSGTTFLTLNKGGNGGNGSSNYTRGTGGSGGTCVANTTAPTGVKVLWTATGAAGRQGGNNNATGDKHPINNSTIYGYGRAGSASPEYIKFIRNDSVDRFAGGTDKTSSATCAAGGGGGGSIFAPGTAGYSEMYRSYSRNATRGAGGGGGAGKYNDTSVSQTGGTGGSASMRIFFEKVSDNGYTLACSYISGVDDFPDKDPNDTDPGWTGGGGGITPPSTCVFPGTQIALNETTTVDIVDYEPRSPLACCHPDTLEYSIQQSPAKLIYRQATQKVTLTLEDGKTIDLTPAHVIATKEGFKDYLDESNYPKYSTADEVATIDGYKKITSIIEETVDPTPVYNIITETNFMVANGIIVAGELDFDLQAAEERAARNARFARGASTWALTGPGGGTNKDIM